MDPVSRIILPLDVSDAAEAERLVTLLRDHVGAFKVGLELINAVGPRIFPMLRSAGARRIFYDAKLHDIPNTVAGAVRSSARHGLWMLNAHACGGSRMLGAAADAAREMPPESRPLLIAVTLLTSLSQSDLESELRVNMQVGEYAVGMARMAREAGVQGVVASAQEAEAIRAACGPDFLIVTPGVRPAGGAAQDQRRTVTPREALTCGADYLVIGRPITAEPDPVAAARRIVEELS